MEEKKQTTLDLGDNWVIFDPRSPLSYEPAEGYPLTKEEVLILAEHWFEQYLDSCVFSTLHGQIGSSDLRIRAYADERLELMEDIVGKDEVKATCDRVEARWRKQMGEELWAAFTEGRAVLGDDARAAEDEEQRDGEVGDKEIDRYTYRFNGRDGTFNLIEIVNAQHQVIATLYYWDEPDTDEAKRVEESASAICKHLNQWRLGLTLRQPADTPTT